MRFDHLSWSKLGITRKVLNEVFLVILVNGGLVGNLDSLILFKVTVGNTLDEYTK